LLKHNSKNKNPEFKTKICNTSEKPIECILNTNGEIIVVDGNHTLGL
jgi:hypothetical protein